MAKRNQQGVRKVKKIKVEWCENFIRATFKKLECKGIEVGCFWGMAEKSGLWERDTYDTPMSRALSKLTTVDAVQDVNGNILYHFFRLKIYVDGKELNGVREISFLHNREENDLPILGDVKNGSKRRINVFRKRKTMAWIGNYCHRSTCICRFHQACRA